MCRLPSNAPGFAYRGIRSPVGHVISGTLQCRCNINAGGPKQDSFVPGPNTARTQPNYWGATARNLQVPTEYHWAAINSWTVPRSPRDERQAVQAWAGIASGSVIGLALLILSFAKSYLEFQGICSCYNVQLGLGNMNIRAAFSTWMRGQDRFPIASAIEETGGVAIFLSFVPV